MDELSQEEIERRQAALKRADEAYELLKQYKAIVHSQRGQMLPLSQEAQNRVSDRLIELRKKAWEEYGVDFGKFL